MSHKFCENSLRSLQVQPRKGVREFCEMLSFCVASVLINVVSNNVVQSAI